MDQPLLYVKRGCPYCRAAVDYLNEKQIAHKTVEVRGDATAMQQLQEVSGQTKTPTLVWHGKVLADFGTEELETFLQQRATSS